MWANLGSVVGSAMFVWAMFQQYFPHDLRRYIEKYADRLMKYVYPYVKITFHEYNRDHFMRSEVYSAIEIYLAASDSAKQAKNLTAALSGPAAKHGPNNLQLVLTIAEHEEVEDEFRGAKVWWSSSSVAPKTQSFSFSFYGPQEDKKYFRLTFHKRDRELIITDYLPHVIKQGRSIMGRRRQRKLYTNYGSTWSHVVFNHPASFDSIAMEAAKKKEIIDDLVAFSNAEDFYARIGKAWKRGYLLYGPPGTGKSTMIAAMANLLSYDVYDLELTAVKDNTELRKLLLQTSSKSLIVIEDIDCSLDLTGQRKKEKEGQHPEAGTDKEQLEKKVLSGSSSELGVGESKSSKVTLSGLLNFIDGLWSACKGERLIVFTTNFKEKLDPALIRRGRMDKHIELSYCKYGAFKILASNYWRLDTHPKFDAIGRMLEEVDVTPADVAECLMPKTEVRDVEDCLEGLIETLVKAKEDAKLKAEEEERKLKTKTDEKDSAVKPGEETAEVEESKGEETAEAEESEGEETAAAEENEEEETAAAEESHEEQEDSVEDEEF